MKFHLSFFSLLTLCFVLGACSSRDLLPGAEAVRVSHKEPGKECKFVGDVTGNQGNFFTGAWTSNSNLETGARNDMKNKAFQMGGNYIALLTNRAGQTGSSGQYGGSTRQTNVTLSGSVFKCP